MDWVSGLGFRGFGFRVTVGLSWGSCDSRVSVVLSPVFLGCGGFPRGSGLCEASVEL